jgi:hypothetical protein
MLCLEYSKNYLGKRRAVRTAARVRAELGIGGTKILKSPKDRLRKSITFLNASLLYLFHIVSRFNSEIHNILVCTLIYVMLRYIAKTILVCTLIYAMLRYIAKTILEK